MTPDALVLFVDDEKTVLDALRDQVRSLFGAQVLCETAETADEAHEVLDELMEEGEPRVVLVVSDWLMPRTRGDEFLAAVRHRYPTISRVMLTGQADAAVIDRVRAEGLVDALLFKPWEADELRLAVDKALEA